MKMNLVMSWIAILALLSALLWMNRPIKDIYVSNMEMNILKAEWANPALDTSIDGNPIQIGGRMYAKGIGIHANSEIAITVPTGYTQFIVHVGVDDEISENHPGSIIFRIVGDETVLYESPLIRSTDLAYRAVVNVKDIQQLILIASGGEDGNNSDHGDWALARFTR